MGALRGCVGHVSQTSAYRRVLWHLLGTTRGAPTRIQILLLLRERPRNTNQLALDMRLDYKTIEHHLRILTENHVVAPAKDGYAADFHLTHEMRSHLDEFEKITHETAPRKGARSSEGPS